MYIVYIPFENDIVFQDSIEYVELTQALESVSDGLFDFKFQELDEEDERHVAEEGVVRSITGIAWNKTKVNG